MVLLRLQSGSEVMLAMVATYTFCDSLYIKQPVAHFKDLLNPGIHSQFYPSSVF